MELSKIVEMPEFQYFYYIVDKYKDLNSKHKSVIESRDFKLGNILSDPKYRELDELYQLKHRHIRERINMIRIEDIQIEDLNKIREIILEADVIVENLGSISGINFDDDLPF